jgi:hypothetical protein
MTNFNYKNIRFESNDQTFVRQSKLQKQWILSIVKNNENYKIDKIDAPAAYSFKQVIELYEDYKQEARHCCP